MSSKDILLAIFFTATISFILIFFHLPIETVLPIFLLSTGLLLLFRSQSQQLEVNLKFILIFLFYFLINLFSVFSSPSKFTSLFEALKIFAAILVVILGSNLFKEKKLFKIVSFWLIIFSSFLALIGIVEFTSRPEITKNLGLFIPFSWPEFSAIFFALFLPLTLWRWLTEKNSSLKEIVYFICSFLLTTAWILTKTYLVLLLAITLVVLFFYFYQEKQKEKLKVDKKIIFFFILLSIIVPNFWYSFGGLPTKEEIISFQEKLIFRDRNDIWRFSWQTVKVNPLRGVGVGNFGNYYYRHQTKPFTWSEYASNEPLQVLVETGFPGLITLLILYSFIILTMVKKLKNDKSFEFILISISVVTFIALTFLNSSFRIFPIQICFFLLFSSILEKETTTVIPRGVTYLFILPIFFFSFLFFTNDLKLRFAKSNFIAGKIERSEKLLKANLKSNYLINPKNYYWLSAIELEKGNWQLAIDYLKLAQKINPFENEIPYQIAKIEYNNSTKEASLQTLKNIVTQNPFQSPKYYFALASLYQETNQSSHTKEILLNAIEKFPFEILSPPKKEFMKKTSHYDDILQLYFLASKVFSEPKYLQVFSQ